MIKAIETVYKGYRFRSRLEARWAVFFDALRVKWEYEKEGYDLGDAGWYLPDFWLPYPEELNFGNWPNPGVWYEIKPFEPNDEEIGKMAALSVITKHSGHIVYGLPGENPIVWTHNSGNQGITDDTDMIDYGFAENEFSLWCDMTQLTNHADRIHDGIRAARSARFEHGEQP